jgi:hypothetical protein
LTAACALSSPGGRNLRRYGTSSLVPKWDGENLRRRFSNQSPAWLNCRRRKSFMSGMTEKMM